MSYARQGIGRYLAATMVVAAIVALAIAWLPRSTDRDGDRPSNHPEVPPLVITETGKVSVSQDAVPVWDEWCEEVGISGALVGSIGGSTTEKSGDDGALLRMGLCPFQLMNLLRA